ncbi:hypothetical protein BDV18DRAFT_149855 [Aspergillus unguis]
MLHGAWDGDALGLYDCRAQRPTRVISEYLLQEVPEFQQLSKLQKKTIKHFYKIIEEIRYNMQQLTGKHSILNICMALGGFLAAVLYINPEAQALGFSLPKYNNRHNVLLPKHPNIILKFLNITMLAANMGLTDFLYNHLDAGNFLPGQFKPKHSFDLVLYNGQVLRNHERAAYQEHREHIKPGGTMIVLLHKVKALYTKITILGTDAMYHNILLKNAPGAEALLKEFSPRLVKLGKKI